MNLNSLSVGLSVMHVTACRVDLEGATFMPGWSASYCLNSRVHTRVGDTNATVCLAVLYCSAKIPKKDFSDARLDEAFKMVSWHDE